VNAQSSQSEVRTDFLGVLLDGRGWIRERLDQLEFLDLTSLRRRITFTLDADRVKSRLAAAEGWNAAFPLGLFRRGAVRTGIRLTDGTGTAVPYLTQAESDDRVRSALRNRFAALGIKADEQLLTDVTSHQTNACRILANSQDDAVATSTAIFDGYADLAASKWGCPAVGRLLLKVRAADVAPEDEQKRTELIRLLFDVQNNFVLLVRKEAAADTLELSYDEELLEWQPPWERRVYALTRQQTPVAIDLQGTAAEAERSQIGRAPFAEDLKALAPPLGLLEAPLWLRALGRRGLLTLAWHVVWDQASSRDVDFHTIEVRLPPQLKVVRLRMVEATICKNSEIRRRERVVAAPLAGNHARILAPREDRHVETALRPLAGMLLSLVVAQSRGSTWLAGLAVAALTAAALMLAAFLALAQVDSQIGGAVTVLVLVPTLVAGLLSVTASNDITRKLTGALSLLIGGIAVITAACTTYLVIQPSPAAGELLKARQLTPLKIVWIVGGSLLAVEAGILLLGLIETRRQIRYRDPVSSTQPESVDPGRALLASGSGANEQPRSGAPRIRPPDRWIQTGEGDRIPWGWLWYPPESAAPGQTRAGRGLGEDKRYWNAVYEQEPNTDVNPGAEALVRWREERFLDPSDGASLEP
jgi:hypothetical protein